MLCRASGEFWQYVIHWRREWQTTSVFLPWEPHEQYESQKDRTLKDEFPRSVVPDLLLEMSGEITLERMKGWSQSKTNTQLRMGLGDRSKVQCCKEQYCIGTWNVRSMNQGKLEVVKQEMARVNIDILGISKLRWTGMGEFSSDDHYIYYCGQESLRRNGVAIIVNKRVQNAGLGCNLKNKRWSLFVSKANHSISR